MAWVADLLHEASLSAVAILLLPLAGTAADRTLWVHSNGNFRHLGGSAWEETVNGTVLKFVELSRDGGVINLRREPQTLVRLLDDHCELKTASDPSFRKLYAGKWSKAKFADLDQYASHIRTLLGQLSEAEKLYVGMRLNGEPPTISSDEVMLDGMWGTRKDPFIVSQVIGPTKAVIRYGDFTWILSGLPTAGWADDKSYSPESRTLFVHGSESFRTVIGATRTLGVIHAVDRPEIEEVIRGTEFVRRARKFETIGEASFSELKAGQASFDLLDGTTVKFRLDDLAAGDRKWISDFQAKETAEQRQREKKRRESALRRAAR